MIQCLGESDDVNLRPMRLDGASLGITFFRQIEMVLPSLLGNYDELWELCHVGSCLVAHLFERRVCLVAVNPALIQE